MLMTSSSVTPKSVAAKPSATPEPELAEVDLAFARAAALDVVAKDGKPGPVTCRFYDTLNAIRNGEAEDVHGWNLVLDL